MESILNPFDVSAIEEGVRIRERLGGKVTAITMGPPQAKMILQEALSVGVDAGILLSDKTFAGADTLATSYTLACAIRALGRIDLILCGKQAIDGDTAQVGPGIAAHLDIPQIIFVKKIREISETKVVAERVIEDGIEIVSSHLPVLISVVKDINKPRFPTLHGLMEARKAQIPIWGARDLDTQIQKLGLNGSPTWVDKIFTPPVRKGGKMFQGESSQVVASFFSQIGSEFFLS